jgi:hypothetical protein
MMSRSQFEMSSEVARDVIWALRTAGADLTADEVILRIADSLGHTYPQLEVEGILEDLVKAGEALKGTATGRSTYKWLGAGAVKKPRRLAS